jgi:ABC-type sugar transport system permease subunit
MKYRNKYYKLFLAQGLIFPILLVGIPIAYTTYLSLRDLNLMLVTDTFIGFKNYIKVFSDTDFIFHSFLRTIIYVLIVCSANFIIGFLMAITVAQIKSRWRDILPILFILPMLLVPAAVATFWRIIMYSPPYAEINRLFGISINLLANKETALGAVILADIWSWTPWVFLPLLGGLEGLDSDFIEAAKIDGASGLRIIWNIILPILKPIIIVTMSLRAVVTFRSFEYIWVMTKGGPGGTSHNLSTYIYDRAFYSLDYGYGSAMSIIMVVFVFIMTMLVIRYITRIKAT